MRSIVSKIFLRPMALAIVSFCLCSVSSATQTTGQALSCDDNWNNDRQTSHCEIREQTLPSSGGALSVDGRQNGGISINGWDRAEVLVRAKVQTRARTQEQARALAGQVRVETGGANVRAEGPSTEAESHWSVSYEVFVPRRSDLSLRTHNGGIRIAGVSGRIEFTALNGGVSLRDLGGSVRGQTTNGGLSVELTGNRWEGEGLDARTTNGGARVAVPENYSARLETSTVRGEMRIDLPGAAAQHNPAEREFAADLGAGGATLRVVTTNGGVRVSRK